MEIALLSKNEVLLYDMIQFHEGWECL